MLIEDIDLTYQGVWGRDSHMKKTMMLVVLLSGIIFQSFRAQDWSPLEVLDIQTLRRELKIQRAAEYF